ncbi:MAG: carbamoyltransferase HypF [Bacteroidetes bacterium]|nr:carbamoyltransferase HypF [Bacteroidota bacterium]MBT6686373.1 carbamoyltransferase HypF [Bacteroidota bacterium]MBT7142206.1 carbamoyltransferase HypF [Bacteroidota bacterium]MBT7490439.1 carbamoyltransferase HypF [Bacteroidota bacterium]
MQIEKTEAYLIEVKGLVQGVGFRPFIYRIALNHRIFGWVENRNTGVLIHAEAKIENINSFIRAIKSEAPIASNIASIDHKKIEKQNFKDFQIVKSKNTSEEITEISPDIGVCKDCLEDIKIQSNRINYPFVNCTNCGPRFSIIKDLPYDRDKTTMEKFEMCKTCHHEYTDILDRRFHAQPIACSDCGPQYEIFIEGKTFHNFDDIIEKIVELLNDGKIIAIKGVGGFHIMCDATNENAVSRLRKMKVREGKPFAVMFSDLQNLKKYVHLNSAEELSIKSWRNPIVICSEKEKLAKSVSLGFNTIGAMLPYMPIHYLLFEKIEQSALVLTSGNISDEPIIIDNEIAKEQLSEIADAVVCYNRDIYNRTDDSVTMIINEKERLIRRSRSYVPSPLRLKMNVEGIVAAGAELVNCFCIGKENQAIMSQHIGDLKNLETLDFYTETFEQFKKLFRLKPEIIACDLHPDYLSTKFAKSTDYKKVFVQHHHAHIASCMAEHGLDEKVIGVSFDGTGLGDDGNIWGAEFFVCDLNNYERVSHFEYMPMPGGDKVTKETWRMAISYLYDIYGKDFINLDLNFLKKIDNHKINLLIQAIDLKINSPLCSSAGRLFDAIAALLDICVEPKFHAEAPMQLENLIIENCDDEYDFSFDKTISFSKTIRQIVTDIVDNQNISSISTKFHNTIISVIFAIVYEMRLRFGINKIVLSGGTFQNKYILEKVEKKLRKEKYKVFSHSKIPTNDGGIALGQLAIAAKRRELEKMNNKD